MREIPEELRNTEVRKFEDVAFLSNEEETNIDRRNFYIQQFEIEMVKKYFEENINLGEAWALIYEYDIRGLTLSDLIDACLNSDIKLRWKS